MRNDTNKTREEYTRANRDAWNEAAPRHAEHNNAKLFEAFKDPKHIELEGYILELLKRIDVGGSRLFIFAVTMVAKPYHCATWALGDVSALMRQNRFWPMAEK